MATDAPARPWRVYRCSMSSTEVFRTSLPTDALTAYVERLLTNHIPDGAHLPYDLAPFVLEALARVEHCFANIHRKYYNVSGVVEFDHLNSDHVAAFLYFLGNTVWKSTGDTIVPTKLFYLNKILHGLDLYFAVALPSVFLLVHPVGTVIGNASYGEYLVVYQNCTIGSDAGRYPHFGEGTILYAKASVIGDCTVGDNVTFAANSFIVNTDIGSDSVVVGQYPQHRSQPSSTRVRTRLFEPADR